MEWPSLHSTSARQQILTTFQLKSSQIFWTDKKQLWCLHITKPYLIPQTQTFNSRTAILQIPIIVDFQKKNQFLGAFYEDVVPTVGGVPSASLPHKFWWIVTYPGLLLLLGNELFQVQYTHPLPFQLQWHWTKWATELDDDTCGGSKSQNTQSSPVSPSPAIHRSCSSAADRTESSAWLQLCLRGPCAFLGLVCVLSRETGYWTGHWRGIWHQTSGDRSWTAALPAPLWWWCDILGACSCGSAALRTQSTFPGSQNRDSSYCFSTGSVPNRGSTQRYCCVFKHTRGRNAQMCPRLSILTIICANSRTITLEDLLLEMA